jgi:hypothetical protein
MLILRLHSKFLLPKSEGKIRKVCQGKLTGFALGFAHLGQGEDEARKKVIIIDTNDK